MAQTSSKGERANRVVGGPYKGMYGNWELTQGDVDGVTVYRASLLVSAMSTALGVAAINADIGNRALFDALFGVHTVAFGVSLATIHIYMSSMHNTLKALYGLGVAGALALLAANVGGDAGLVMSVVEHPALMLAVGWQFVALTGLYIKEAMCFARIEAFALAALVPVITGGHFLGIVKGPLADGALIAFAAFYVFFAVRKFTQPSKDDLGDLSIFQHLAANKE